jgi:AbrB family looped-hinge helix DNA binding protein
MSLVTIKKKYQIVIPAKVRKAAGLNVGDFLEASAEEGKITFTPKSLIDREIEEALEDFKMGRTSGPFETHEALMEHLKGVARKYRAKKRP